MCVYLYINKIFYFVADVYMSIGPRVADHQGMPTFSDPCSCILSANCRATRSDGAMRITCRSIR